jgi:4-diphosphocytidyl-2-C-methyl-D-erythritol kinase
VSGPAAAVAAQAKVNLFLHILAREASGYHQLETLFCRLTLADDVVVRIGRGWNIDCDTSQAGPPEENLAYRAARLYAAERGWPAGCTIEIAKRIPVGGGLGGGSADAGAVLRCLHTLDPAAPPRDALLRWAARLGADVPALTLESPLALGFGRGERLMILPALPARAVMLYIPRTRVATRDAYDWLAAARTRRETTALPLSRAIAVQALQRWESLAPIMANDFVPIVAGRHAEIARFTSAMGALPGARASLMSGSGSTVFCVFDGPVPQPWPLAADDGAAFIETATADHVVGVRRIE